MYKLLLILPLLTLIFQPLNAKPEAANQKLDLTVFDGFFPGKKIEDVEKTFGKGEITNNSGGIETKKFLIPKRGFKVMVQVKDGVILDFFAGLPSALSHDVFHKALIDKLGKQTTYKRVQEEATYVWDLSPLKHIYSGACTITCFTVFYSVQPMVKDQPSILERMQK